MGLTLLQSTELKKIATDAGFDRSAVETQGWLVLRSSHFAEPVELTRTAQGANLVRVETAIRSRDPSTLPGVRASARQAGAGRVGTDSMTLVVSDDGALLRLLEFIATEAVERRDRPLAIFEAKTRGLPATTEVERLTIQRIGQDVFRAALIEYWDGRCAVTGCGVRELLRASHIKPWARCDSDAERLDRLNGLLLSPTWDAAFDSGLVTFGDDGAASVSPLLGPSDRASLGIHDGARLRGRLEGQQVYLAYHRERVFRRGGASDA